MKSKPRNLKWPSLRYDATDCSVLQREHFSIAVVFFLYFDIFFICYFNAFVLREESIVNFFFYLLQELSQIEVTQSETQKEREKKEERCDENIYINGTALNYRITLFALSTHISTYVNNEARERERKKQIEKKKHTQHVKYTTKIH